MLKLNQDCKGVQSLLSAKQSNISVIILRKMYFRNIVRNEENTFHNVISIPLLTHFSPTYLSSATAFNLVE